MGFLSQISDLIDIIRNKKKLPLAKRTFRRHIPIFINRFYYKTRYGSLGDEIVYDEWDNLIILDAARPDILTDLSLFEEYDVQERYSPGSYSLQFMKSQFEGRNLHDTVYITPNPHIKNISGDIFHDVIFLEGQWDEDLKTVPPQEVIKVVKNKFECYQDKRLIIHFMQPHYPFIQKEDNELNREFTVDVGNQSSGHPWNEQMFSPGAHKELIRLYRDNHEVVAPYVKELVEYLPNKTVVTSDHANLIGERGFPIPIRMYGHPPDFPHPKLLTIPWIEIDGDRRITRSEPNEQRNEEVDDKLVEERLSALGYK